MSGIRSLTRRPTIAGYASAGSAPIYVDSDDNIPKIIPSGTGTTELPFVLSATASGARVAGGTGTLVTGTAAITTGLTTVLSFTCSQTTQPTGTGVNSDQILVPTWATGTVTVTAYSVSTITGATIAASGSTGSFSWIAIGV